MQHSKSVARVRPLETNSFQEKFKGKMSSISKKGLNQALLGNSATVCRVNKENTLPPIRKVCTLSNPSPSWIESGSAKQTPHYYQEEPKQFSSEMLPKKQQSYSQFSSQSKKGDVCRPDDTTLNYALSPLTRNATGNPLRLSMSHDQDFQQHLRLLDNLRFN